MLYMIVVLKPVNQTPCFGFIYHLFPYMKKHLAGKHNDDDVCVLDDTFDQQDESFFNNGIWALQHWWTKSVNCKVYNVEK